MQQACGMHSRHEPAYMSSIHVKPVCMSSTSTCVTVPQPARHCSAARPHLDTPGARHQVLAQCSRQARAALGRQLRQEGQRKAVVQRPLQPVQRCRGGGVAQRPAQRAQVVAGLLAGAVLQDSVLRRGAWCRLGEAGCEQAGPDGLAGAPQA